MNAKHLFLSSVLLFCSIVCSHHYPETQKNHSDTSIISNNKLKTRQNMAPAKEGQKEYVPGEILVKFKEGSGDDAIKAIEQELQLETIRLIFKPNLYLMKIQDGSSVEAAIERLQSHPDVVYSEPNYRRSTNTKVEEMAP